ncbi:MAG: exopolyphosphatase [Candidatus Cloacimonetes bacterium]|nr:exopolyphosphatase [Candidatus Cloacimonadota bacterium]
MKYADVATTPGLVSRSGLRIAAFDFGSNATKCLIAELRPPRFVELAQYRIQNRLSAALDADGILSEASICAAITAAIELMQHCQHMHVTKFLAVGTEALRRAKNSSELIHRLEQACGLQIRVISAEEEAELSFLGVISGLNNPKEDILLIDSGGASTELIFGINGMVRRMQSLPLGAVTLTQEFIHSDPISEADFSALNRALEHDIKKPNWHGKLVLANGGGVTACAKVAIGNSITVSAELENYYLSTNELKRQITIYRKLSLDERRQIPGMETDRADTILATAMLSLAMLYVLTAPGLHVLGRGLRHGLLQINTP